MDNIIDMIVDDSNELTKNLCEGIVANTDEDSEEKAIKKLEEESTEEK